MYLADVYRLPPVYGTRPIETGIRAETDVVHAKAYTKLQKRVKAVLYLFWLT